MFKKISKIYFGAMILLLPAVTYAFDYGFSSAKGNLPTTVAGASDPAGLVGEIIRIALSLLGIIFFFLIFYGGLVWMTAQGKTERVQKGQDTLEAAFIGLVIVLFAYAITLFVFRGLNQ